MAAFTLVLFESCRSKNSAGVDTPKVLFKLKLSSATSVWEGGLRHHRFGEELVHVGAVGQQSQI